MIKSKWGNFEKGEVVAIVMHGPCGRKYVYKGMVQGVRVCMGKEYLAIKGEDDYIYEVSSTDASQVVAGPEAEKMIEESHRRRRKSMEGHEEKETAKGERQEHESHYYEEPKPSNYPSKYNRI